MKTLNLGINSFSDKLAENQLSKFSKPEFLSKSKNFNDVLKKSEESKEKDKNKFENKDIHFEKLTSKLSGQIKSGTSENKDLLASLGKDQDLLGGALAFDKSFDFINVEKLNPDQKSQQIVQDKNLGKNLDLAKLSSVEELVSKDDNKLDISKLNDKSKIKLDENFKQLDKPQAIDLNNLQKTAADKLTEKNTKLGLNTNDLKSKNDLLIKNTLRSKNIENKGKLGNLKAAMLYEKQQPVEANKAEMKSQLMDSKVASSENIKSKFIKPVAIQKMNSDTLKNNLMSTTTTDVEQQMESNEVIGKDFAKVMDLKGQFKSEGIEDIIKNAQFLANKGGGEMKLLLNPKGLGAVRLKVFMEQNQLKVEMSTETKEAQEIIESTLGDLKKALADGQLDVESITIENFEELAEFAAEDDAQKQNQFAKDFLSEFRHNNNKFRSGLVDSSAVKRRQSQILEQPTISSTKSVNSQRKLDLVA